MHGPIAGPDGKPLFPHVAQTQQAMRVLQPAFITDGDFQPVHDILLVRRLSQLDTELHIPDSIRDKEQHAEVIDVGPGSYTANGILIPPCAKKGDIIFLPSDDGGGRPVGIKVQVKGESLVLVRSHQVLGIVKPANAETAQP